MRYFFRVEYDGARFGGWQNQPNAISVQQLIEEALTVALRAPCAVTGAGRTDAGVHARGQGAHFDVPEDVGINIDTERLTASLNGLLPHDIAVYGMTAVAPGFHARYSAIARRYKYYFTTRKTPLSHKRAWMINYRVDWDRIGDEIKCLSGPRDFTAFCSSGADSKSMECDIKFVNLSMDKDVIILTMEANRFIYKMVRSITGTLVDIGRGRIVETLDSIILSRDRNRAGGTAPAWGLVLENVFYPAGSVRE